MLSSGAIRMLLDELSEELEAQGIHGDLFLVGGAAMALAYSRRRATRDLDAVFEPKQVIYQAAQRVGTAAAVDGNLVDAEHPATAGRLARRFHRSPAHRSVADG